MSATTTWQPCRACGATTRHDDGVCIRDPRHPRFDERTAPAFHGSTATVAPRHLPDDLGFNPERAYFDGTHGNHVCDEREERDGGDMRFVAHIAAPGRGVAYACAVCGADYVRIGGTFIDPNDVDPSELEMQPWECV